MNANQPSLAAEGIVKEFPGVKALAGVDLRLMPGEVHALLGENGAGKSTLINILTGVLLQDAGTVRLRGVPIIFGSALEASHAGIGVVHQEHNLIPGFTVAQNICMASPPTRYGFINSVEEIQTAERALTRLGVSIDPHALVDNLSVAQLRMVEIARTLAFENRVIFLDEPTASLTQREVETLLGTIRRLRDDGCSIVLVSHKLEEVFAACDVATILRDGATVVRSQPLTSTSRDEIVNAMAGRTLAQREYQLRAIDRCTTPMLEIVDLETPATTEQCSLIAYRREIVGLYGLVGAGRSELMRAAVGLDRKTGGTIRLAGTPITTASFSQALHKHRIGYVSEDRRGEGLFLNLDVARNVAVTVWQRLAGRWRGVSSRAEMRIADRYRESLDIRVSSVRQTVGQLSGGNQQKVSLAKWLAAQADVLVIDEPTAGIDVRTKADFHQLITDLADQGTTIILISSDLPEMIGLADRIYLMHENRVISSLDNTKEYATMSKQIMGLIYAAGPSVEAVEDPEPQS